MAHGLRNFLISHQGCAWTAKQSEFLRIQVHVSSQTKGIE